ncbi:hypothetical protein [Neobacillus dielmonensis]|uniref:hypothetical protein n=1 Tax=Neobacillus dielmonensis TaxID=1347369 RepID=UPI0005A649A7|nr:hypothetical protein [Neobacillus dielmonensis]
MSLLILAVVIVGLTLIITKGINGSGGKRGTYSYQKRIKRLFVGYLAVLVISTMVSILLPSQGSVEVKRVKDQDIEKDSQRLYGMAKDGKFEEVDAEFIEKKWNFDYTEQRLNLTFQDDNMIMPVMVKRKANQDGKIEAAYYRSKYSMDGYDITKLLDRPKLKLSGDTLFILKPMTGKLKFSAYTSVFSVKQFKEGSSTGYSSYSIGGANILYLSIPQNLDLISENLDVHYVE